MTLLNPLKPIIAKHPKPLMQANAGWLKGEHLVARSVYGAVRLPNECANRQISNESLVNPVSEKVRFNGQSETIIGRNTARGLPTVPDIECA